MSGPPDPNAHENRTTTPNRHARIQEEHARIQEELARQEELKHILAATRLLDSLTRGVEPDHKDLGVLSVPKMRAMMRALLEEAASLIKYGDRTIADIAREARASAHRVGAEAEAVQKGPGQSTINPEQEAMADPSTPTETELRIQLAEARTDKKFAETLSEMRAGFAEIRGEMQAGFAQLGTRLEAVERSTSGIRTTVITTAIGTGLGVLALVVAIMSYGQTWFGIGVTNRDTIRAIVAEMQAHPPIQPSPGAH